jgi:ParB-like chromosome segregation protein Spo0J
LAEDVRVSFERRVVVLPVTSVLPQKKLSDAIVRTVKYRRIVRSIAEIGIIEPLVVARMNKREKRYLLLDGHIRLAALVQIGQPDARCLVAADDEAFTYNKRVSRLATVQEHFMIMRAIKRGVSAERLAKALNVNIKLIARRKTLLDGICPEAVDLLKDKTVNPQTFETLRKMKPMRQIEAAELMVTAGNWSAGYAKALLAATKQEDLAKPERPKKILGLTSEQMARMEREMTSLHQDFKQIESSYGDDILHLVVASGYIQKLVSNPEIERFLTQRYPEFLQEFRAIISAASLDQASAST